MCCRGNKMSEEKIFLGYNKPTLKEIINKFNSNNPTRQHCVIVCDCGDNPFGSLVPATKVIEYHYNKGCYNVPIYCTKEEMMEKVAKEIASKKE